MKRLLLLGLLALTGAAQASVLFQNGPVVVGAAPNGLSIIRAGGSLFCLGSQTFSGNSVADDFGVGAALGWTVETIDFYAYQTGEVAFPFTSVVWSIVSGDVNTGAVVASGTTAVTNGGLQGYRVTSTTLTNQQRPIWDVSADIPDVVLNAGNYFLRWSLAGSGVSGPWQPPTSDGAAGNAFQSVASAPFAAAVDAGDGLGLTLPFTLNGRINTPNGIPEPGTLALLLAAGLGIARRRRTR
jgi:hypothetical protein